MKIILTALALAAAPVLAQADTQATAEQLARIDEILAAKSCEVDHADVEVEDGQFDLDDVICADGQYDILLGADFAVVTERKE